MRHGFGKERWPNGDLYEGEYQQDLFHGKGALKSRGGWYRGQFEKGVKVSRSSFTNGMRSLRSQPRRPSFSPPHSSAARGS